MCGVPSRVIYRAASAQTMIGFLSVHDLLWLFGPGKPSFTAFSCCSKHVNQVVVGFLENIVRKRGNERIRDFWVSAIAGAFSTGTQLLDKQPQYAPLQQLSAFQIVSTMYKSFGTFAVLVALSADLLFVVGLIDRTTTHSLRITSSIVRELVASKLFLLSCVAIDGKPMQVPSFPPGRGIGPGAASCYYLTHGISGSGVVNIAYKFPTLALILTCAPKPGLKVFLLQGSLAPGC